MNVEDFRTLYDFNFWANSRTLESCAALTPEEFTRDLGSSFGSVRDTLMHICGVEWAWLERWHGRTPSAFPKAADYPDFQAVKQRWEEIERNLLDYIASLTADDVNRLTAVTTISSGTFELPLAYYLQHLANHGTYHRGQIATMLRQLGTKAVSTDLVGFYRQRAASAGS